SGSIRVLMCSGLEPGWISTVYLPTYGHYFTLGSSNTFSDVLNDVLRNYIIQSTSAAFERSYQAENIRVNPLRLRFQRLHPEAQAWDTEHLEQAMRTMVLKSDPNAPVKPSQDYLQRFERRYDVSTL